MERRWYCFAYPFLQKNTGVPHFKTDLTSQFKGKIYDIVTIGWFGPVGVAALYYAIHSQEKTGLKYAWIITSLVVFGSTIAPWYHKPAF